MNFHFNFRSRTTPLNSKINSYSTGSTSTFKKSNPTVDKSEILNSYRKVMRSILQTGIKKTTHSSTVKYIKEIYKGNKSIQEILKTSATLKNLELNSNTTTSHPSKNVIHETVISSVNSTNVKSNPEEVKIQFHPKTESEKIENNFKEAKLLETDLINYFNAVNNQRTLLDLYNIGKKEDLRKDVQNTARIVGLDANPIYNKMDKMMGKEVEENKSEKVVGKKTFVLKDEKNEKRVKPTQQEEKKQKNQDDSDSEDDDYINFVGFGDGRGLNIDSGIIQSMQRVEQENELIKETLIEEGEEVEQVEVEPQSTSNQSGNKQK